MIESIRKRVEEEAEMADSEVKRLEFDIRGQICPSTLLTALREVNHHQGELRAGEAVLRILTDNRQSTATIPEAIRNMGYLVEVEKDQGHYCIVIGIQR